VRGSRNPLRILNSTVYSSVTKLRFRVEEVGPERHL